MFGNNKLKSIMGRRAAFKEKFEPSTITPIQQCSYTLLV